MRLRAPSLLHRSRRRRTATVVLATVGAALGVGVPGGMAQETLTLQQLKDAAGALQRGQIELAIQRYTEALNDRALSNDRRGVVLNDRGVAQFRKLAHRAAIDDFNRAAQLYPDYAPLYSNRGNVLIALGAIKEAIKDFDRALVLSPGFAAALANRGAAYARLGQHDQAIADYTRAIELAPQSVAALNGRGQAQAAAERPHAAIRDFTRAVTLDSRFAAGYRNRADAKAQIERVDEAIEDYSRALAFDPKSVETYLARGEAYLATNNAAAALKDYSRGLDLDPKSIAAFVGRARAYARAEAYDEALADLAKVLELDPKNIAAHAVRAVVYKQMQQVDLAQKDLERALRPEAPSADGFWAEGELEDARGRNEAAIVAFTKALAIDPRHRPTLDSLSRMGLVATREETELASAGTERWRVMQSGDQYTAISDAFPNLRVPLEMLGRGKPALLDWERKRAPHQNIGVLRFSAGRFETAGGVPEELESAAIIDVTTQTILGLPLHRKGAKIATWTWDESKLVVASAEGLTEEFPFRVKPSVPVTGPAVAAAPPRRNPSDSAPKSGFTPPSWSPWATPGGSSSGGGNRQASGQRRPKTLFEMLFGN